jgi:hypothetical protein
LPLTIGIPTVITLIPNFKQTDDIIEKEPEVVEFDQEDTGDELFDL